MAQRDINPPHRLRRPKINLGYIIVFAISILLVGFLAIPVLALIGRSLTTGQWNDIPDTIIIEAIMLSATTTSIATLINFVLGMPLAYILARWYFPFRTIINVLIQLPIILPPAVAGLALLLAFGRNGVFGPIFNQFGISIPFTTSAVIMAQIFVSAPFFIRTASAAFSEVNEEIEDAARVDGATDWQIFRFITFPLVKNMIGAGLVLSWARALGEFGATILFAGSITGTTQTMPLLVYNILERDLDAAILTAVILILLALVALLFSNLLVRNSQLNLK